MFKNSDIYYYLYRAFSYTQYIHRQTQVRKYSPCQLSKLLLVSAPKCHPQEVIEQRSICPICKSRLKNWAYTPLFYNSLRMASQYQKKKGVLIVVKNYVLLIAFVGGCID